MANDRTTLALAAGMGFIAGMRSMSAPALLSRHLSQQARRPGGSAATRLLASRQTAWVLTALAAGETVGDKTPYVPDRTEPPALAGRALSGALCGAAIAGWRGNAIFSAALVSATTAIGATFLAYTLRKEAADRVGVPDLVLAFLEDAIVLAVGSRLAATV